MGQERLYSPLHIPSLNKRRKSSYLFEIQGNNNKCWPVDILQLESEEGVPDNKSGTVGDSEALSISFVG